MWWLKLMRACLQKDMPASQNHLFLYVLYVLLSQQNVKHGGIGEQIKTA